MASAVSRKSIGSQVVYQSGESCEPMTRSTDPKEDWCMVGRTTPRAIKTNMYFWSHSRSFVEAQPVEKGGGELDPEDQDVGHHAHGDFEHHRIRVHLPGEHDVVCVPVTPQVDDQRGGRQGVAEQTTEQGRPHQGVELVAVEDVDQERHGEAAAAERGGDHDVDDHPDPPGISAAQVGYVVQAEQKAPEDEIARDCGEHAEEDKGLGDDLAAEGLMGMCHELIRRLDVLRLRPSLNADQPSWSSTSLRRWVLRRAKTASPPSRASGPSMPLYRVCCMPSETWAKDC